MREMRKRHRRKRLQETQLWDAFAFHEFAAAVKCEAGGLARSRAYEAPNPRLRKSLLAWSAP